MVCVDRFDVVEIADERQRALLAPSRTIVHAEAPIRIVEDATIGVPNELTVEAVVKGAGPALRGLPACIFVVGKTVDVAVSHDWLLSLFFGTVVSPRKNSTSTTAPD